jgi:DNA-binding Lrp family transcriptional regulator
MNDLPKLDRIDIRILSALQKDSSVTNAALAEAVYLSPSPCLKRVRRLEKAGYIESYNARLNLAKLGDYVTVFTQVTLSDHHREDFVKFEAEIRRYDAVQECHLVSGGYDYLLKFVVRSITHYQELVEDILARRIGMDKYFSYVVIKTLISKSSVPLNSLISDGGLRTE